MAEYFPIFFGVGLAVVVVLIIVQLRLAALRRKALRRLAGLLGASFFEKDPFGLHRHRKRFPVMARGSGHHAFNVIDNDELTIFDYQWTTSDGKHTHTHHNTYVLFESPVDLGELAVRPEHWGDKLAAAVGFDDIDFESAEFSKRYHVKADDRKFAYGLFDAEMIEYFLGLPRLSVWGSEKLILAGRKERQLKIHEIRRLVGDIRGMVERIPRYLIKDRSTS